VTRPKTPAEAWRALEQGNARFVHGDVAHPGQDAARRTELQAGQKPFALLFGCSDSRLAAELIFDQGLGDMFVVRTAGHVVDTGVLGSVEYGVAVLSIPLVVVLGHDSCGAVAATLEAVEHGVMPGGYVRDVVERITPSVLTARRAGAVTVEDVEVEHVRHTARLLVDRSVILSDAVAAGRCAVVGAAYTLAAGRARLVDGVGDLRL
jgi:carbonic anhydrase